MTFLWTDVLIWLVVLSLGLLVHQVRKTPRLRQAWGQVFASKLASLCALVLLGFLAVALLDSLHFYQGSRVVSLLDLALSHLQVSHVESYSAPFAHVIRPLDSGALVVLSLVVLVAFVAIGVWHRCAAHRLRTWVLSWSVAGIGLALGLFLLSQSYHIAGTDKVGLDVFYQTLKSVRTGVMIGVLTTVVMLPIAVFLGVAAGYFRGWVDDVVQFSYTTLNSVPGVLLIAAAVLVMQSMMVKHADFFASEAVRADMRLLFLCLILGITSWTGLARLLRAETLKIRALDYVVAAQAFGVSHFKILMAHVLPNVMHIVLIAVVLDFSGLVLAEAVLSYVGIGVDPSMHSWGNMINSARLEMAREPIVWWPLASAFVMMFVLVLAANLFADAVRDAFDPRSVR